MSQHFSFGQFKQKGQMQGRTILVMGAWQDDFDQRNYELYIQRRMAKHVRFQLFQETAV